MWWKIARFSQKNQKTYNYYLVLDDPTSLENKDQILETFLQKHKGTSIVYVQTHEDLYCE